MSSQQEKIQKKIESLTNLINKWNKEYYVENNPSVSDQEYDEALLELEELEKQFPRFILANSPTLSVGGFAENKFAKYTHEKPMLSLAKAYSLDEVGRFFDNTSKALNDNNLSYSLEPKIDGLSIALHYNNGVLEKAVTRGDGVIGEDVTENIYQIQTIPKKINYLSKIEIRGEVFLPKTRFEELNKQLAAKDQKTFANPRNAASGTLRQLDPEIVKERKLDAILYDIVSPIEHNLKTQKEALDFLKKNHFNVNPYSFISSDREFILRKIEEFKAIKNNFEFDCDGFVIKLDNVTMWDSLGATAKFPRYAIAFKYETEEAISTIINIKTTVGRTGKITYVAELEPVSLNQTIVRNATLHNYDFIDTMNINLGDEVKVIKSGEIIPKIIGLVKKNSNSIFPKVLNCVSCGSLLIEIDDNVDQFCMNDECSEKQIKNLIHFVSRPAMNILTLGESNIRTFFELGFLSDIPSVFELFKYKDQIIQLPSYKEKKTDNILNSIEASKEIFLYKALFALGIKHIGAQIAEIIAQKINKLSDLINLDFETLSEINTIGPKIIDSLREYVSNPKNQEILVRLDEVLVYKQNKKNESELFSGLVFVITGTLSKTRDYFKNLIEQNGGKVASAVSKNVNYLLAGENAGSKLDKAQKIGVNVINEEELNKLLTPK
ncbi:NAD-dependent DNA ligase LigA [Mycoplasmopsis glycophila]|uniref:DNA ligase n=1 Tax=Mycoplasmopsis glycophila TaxID=171285 RepID=A0A449AU81_9BACT|nr:NAD-dependent DNA ligase LigA [Mycoplasmopsis glycophila]VEU70081.1 DNA ligase (NAD(+)) [Mycoplasmopsis glycophila]